jgi:hypothetical protein
MNIFAKTFAKTKIFAKTFEKTKIFAKFPRKYENENFRFNLSIYLWAGNWSTPF